jgi:outer membrane protein assembly factor BamB
MDKKLAGIVFTGFNKRVAALSLTSGEVLWDWVCPKGSGYVSLLLADDQHLIVSAVGYTYCLDPLTGAQRWFNELSGYGTGVASLVSSGGQGSVHVIQAAAADAEAAAISADNTSTTLGH